jgi:uncharacterized protein YjbJ (UPF0337 family)
MSAVTKQADDGASKDTRDKRAREDTMATQDKDKWEGREKEAGGKVKETAGKVTGDKNLEADGKGDPGKGKVRRPSAR